MFCGVLQTMKSLPGKIDLHWKDVANDKTLKLKIEKKTSKEKLYSINLCFFPIELNNWSMFFAYSVSLTSSLDSMDKT